jgi:hypothetical protein
MVRIFLRAPDLIRILENLTWEKLIQENPQIFLIVVGKVYGDLCLLQCPA